MSLRALAENSKPAVLVLADGSIFSGFSIGAAQSSVGEVVFNTAITGYQEILTDLSYTQQLVTLTYPHIGNVGCNAQDIESASVGAAGLIIREDSLLPSNWRATQSLPSWLLEHQITAIAGVDTRRLTRLLRDKGVQSGCIMPGNDVDQALQLAREFKGTQQVDLARVVTTQRVYSWDQPSHSLVPKPRDRVQNFHVVVYDFGVKQQILRLWVDRGCRLTVVPALTPLEEVLALAPDGVFLSNGPGDPAACVEAIAMTRALLRLDMPVFGICLGFQIIALACGAKTQKMKFGHHGANHPVKDCHSGRVFITSQNHSYCVDRSSLPPELSVTHVSLFDQTVQGLRHSTKPVFAFQGHPEASPGPQDILPLFDEFIQMMLAKRNQHAKTN